MNNPFLSFTIKAIALLAVVFCIHVAILNNFELPLFDNKLILSYVVNFLLVVAVFGILYLLKKKYKEQLGFIFIAGSALKFAVFLIIFKPIYKLDNDISKLEFAAFFMPYIFGLILETYSLSKWLNKLD